MHIFHPPQAVNGMLPENVFYIADSANQTVAEGFIVPTYHPFLFPERPVNLFLSIRSQGAGKDMLLGALLARVRQLHEQTANMRARAFAQVPQQDKAMLDFYIENGFDVNDRLDVIQISAPDARTGAPMGYEMNYVPFRSQAELMGFIQRMNTYRLNVIQPAMMQRYMSLPHFFALYLSRGGEIVGEIVFTGEGSAARLVGLYIVPNYRGRGLAKCLVATGMKILGDRGVTHVEADLIFGCDLQRQLATSCRATHIRTAYYYPGLNYD
ncbi:MAG: GNAT family N-acetyltransferase [Clostridia bacterium]|nr:GNAT family N-acetyltransferase [Clostridia bacterium]